MHSRWITRGTLLALTLGGTLAGCEEKSNKLTVGAKDGADGCELSVATLPDTEWVFLKANPDKSQVPDPTTRLKFLKDGAGVKAKYNVGSISDMYDYGCEEKGKEIICREEVKPKDYCQAFIAAGKECTPELLKGFAPDMTDEQVAKGIKEGNEIAAKYKDKPEWKSFVANNNNLGNKLRGIIYVKLDSKKCRLVVQDNYMTIYNGKKVEDSNPAGTNPFVKNDQGELLWEHCQTSRDLVATKAAELPEDLSTLGHEARHPVGTELHMWYMNEAAQKPTEGCTYSYDTWLNGKPLKKGLKPEVVGEEEKALKWHFAHTFDTPSASGAGDVVHAVVTTTCGAKVEKKVTCAAMLFQ